MNVFSRAASCNLSHGFIGQLSPPLKNQLHRYQIDVCFQEHIGPSCFTAIPRSGVHGRAQWAPASVRCPHTASGDGGGRGGTTKGQAPRGAATATGLGPGVGSGVRDGHVFVLISWGIPGADPTCFWLGPEEEFLI